MNRSCRKQFHWLSVVVLLAFVNSLYAQQRWTENEANAWYEKQAWPVGVNYVPSNAINQLEMWEADSFDPTTIDRELGWAEAIGMNTTRVFLHNLLWEQDPKGFAQRMDTFLAIAARHHIHTIFVLFDSCWDPHPKLGLQHLPIPGIHNSGWVQAPGAEILSDPSQYPRIERYVKGVVGTFANDPRIFAWDIWNEPDNGNVGSYVKEDLNNKGDILLVLLPQVFAWARTVNPTQPLTSGLWQGDWASLRTMSPMARIQVEQSDIISFHNYGWPEEFEQRAKQLEQFHRPVICTEYMARGAGSLFDMTLPMAKRHNLGAISWGLVAGKTQTYLPWDSWDSPYVTRKPVVWFHDIFYPDGKMYRPYEGDLIRKLTSGKERAK